MAYRLIAYRPRSEEHIRHGLNISRKQQALRHKYEMDPIQVLEKTRFSELDETEHEVNRLGEVLKMERALEKEEILSHTILPPKTLVDRLLELLKTMSQREASNILKKEGFEVSSQATLSRRLKEHEIKKKKEKEEV